MIYYQFFLIVGAEAAESKGNIMIPYLLMELRLVLLFTRRSPEVMRLTLVPRALGLPKEALVRRALLVGP